MTAKRTEPNAICFACGVPFITRPYKIRQGPVYCSHACARRGQWRDVKHVSYSCAECGVEVAITENRARQRGVYCSRACQGAALRRLGVRPDATKHGKYKTPEYRTWKSMRQRCLNPRTRAWKYYGGRGITICPEWDDFDVFLRDMGLRPEGTSIDRIDVNGNYEPGNCRWADAVTQRRNQRRSVTA